MSALRIENLSVNRGGLPVVRDVSLVVDPGSITVLLGANGAGKTTLLEGIAGAVPAKGAVEMMGARVDRLGPYARAKQGLALVEQGRAVFRDLTVEENLEVARYNAASTEEAHKIFPELVQRRGVRSGLLSGGEQQMLVIARALLTRPRVLLIDEMSPGLAPIIVRRLMAMAGKLARQGQAILLVEQFAALSLAVGQRAYVLRCGAVVYNGPCAKLRDDPQELHRLYFGEQVKT